MVFMILTATTMVAGADSNQQEDKTTQSKSQIPDLFGIGVGYRTSVYKDGDGRVVPNFLYNSDRFFIRGTHFAYRYYRSDDWSLDAGFKVESFGEDHDDSGTVSDISGSENISKVINGKLGAVYSFNAHRFRFDISHDLSNEHDGVQSEMIYAHYFNFGKVKLLPFIGLEWWGDDVTDYYFGVSENSSRASLYKPDSMLHTIVGVQTMVWLAPRHAIHLRIKHTLCDDDVNDSPLVDKDQYTFTALSYVYRF
jgi:outer membrane protein